MSGGAPSTSDPWRLTRRGARPDRRRPSIYHGVCQTMAGAVYRLGTTPHDLANPAKILSVSDSWILEPEDTWERTGYVPNVAFTCGAVPERDGTVKIYRGGADTVMFVGDANVAELVSLCLEHPRSPK